jgi:hypothetical protein
MSLFVTVAGCARDFGARSAAVVIESSVFLDFAIMKTS